MTVSFDMAMAVGVAPQMAELLAGHAFLMVKVDRHPMEGHCLTVVVEPWSGDDLGLPDRVDGVLLRVREMAADRFERSERAIAKYRRLRERGVPVSISDLHGHGLQAVAAATCGPENAEGGDL